MEGESATPLSRLAMTKKKEYMAEKIETPKQELNNVFPINIEDEMKDSYMNYAMSVIIGRALPDIRDGLKPVHRRVLFAMHELSSAYNKPYKKSARIVGEVIGKFHPHGDVAVYDTIVRMAQDFSLRYPLIDGQGNFGSIDGDPPAAMRYTEVRMAKITDDLLVDLEKETVEWSPNYDESLKEPQVLPAKIPNLLINGSSGIAVGMATNIPPHNISEILDALIFLIDTPNAPLDKLMKIVPGPDFPTAGIISGRAGIKSAYTEGRGIIQIKGKYEVEPIAKTDRERIVITEIPYQVNKARLIERIAELVRDKKIVGISDLRDESDKDGMRIVIELKKDIPPTIIINQLCKHTPFQDSFGIIMLAIVNNKPKIVNLKEALSLFIDFRKEIVIRRTRFELKKAQARAHILEGLKIALDHLDEVIALIKKSKTPEIAKEALMKEFSLSALQSQAILDMRLQRLTGLERQKILDELKEILEKVEYYKKLLADEKLIFGIIKDEFKELKKNYGDKRKTEIADAQDTELTYEDLIKDEDVIVTVSHEGYIKRNDLSLYRSQRRGGKGAASMGTKEDDFVQALYSTSMHTTFLFITNRGKLYWQKVYQIPEASRIARGRPLINLLNLSPNEKVRAILPVKEFIEGSFIACATKNGVVKKTDLMSFAHPRTNGIIAITIDDGDELIAAELTTGKQDILLSTKTGKAIRFNEEEVRSTGRGARGVKGITLKENDRVVSMDVLNPGDAVLTVTEKGYGKRTDTEEYRTQGRGGSGIITIKTTEKNGFVVGTIQVQENDEIMLITNKGTLIRTKVKDISVYGRYAQGVRLINVQGDEYVVSVAPIRERLEGEEDPITNENENTNTEVGA